MPLLSGTVCLVEEHRKYKISHAHVDSSATVLNRALAGVLRSVFSTLLSAPDERQMMYLW